MDYLAFRYTKTQYKSLIDFNDKVKRADVDDIEERLKGKSEALFLSGGLDSSLLAAINKPEVAYTAVFTEGKSELHFAERVAEHLGIPLIPVLITREAYLATIELLIRNKGDGLHPNEPCLYLMAKQASKDGFDTITSGEGADGLFGGYTKLLTGNFMTDEGTFRSRYLQVETGVEIPFKKWQEWGMYRFLIEMHTPALIDRAVNACHTAGMEIEFPYIENGISQIMWEAPMGQKIDKPILKEIATKYLPLDLVYKEKIGFPTPWPVEGFLRLNKEIGW